MLSIKIHGHEALTKMLAELPEKLQAKLVKSAMKKSGAKVLTTAKSNAPVDTGRLREFLRLTTFKTRREIGFRVVTGTREEMGIDPKDTGFYPMSIEFGTQKRPARPFMRPALERHVSTITADIAADLREGIQEAQR